MRGENLLLVAAFFWIAGHDTGATEEISFTPVPDLIPTTISYDVAGGHYDETRRELPCGIDTVSATVRMSKTHVDEKWVPIAQLILNNPIQYQPPQPPDLQLQTVH